MNDKEKLEAIGRRVNEVNYSITLLVNDIKEILEKKTLTDYEKLVVDIINEINYLSEFEKPTKANYEMTIQRIKKRIKYPNLPTTKPQELTLWEVATGLIFKLPTLNSPENILLSNFPSLATE